MTLTFNGRRFSTGSFFMENMLMDPIISHFDTACRTPVVSLFLCRSSTRLLNVSSPITKEKESLESSGRTQDPESRGTSSLCSLIQKARYCRGTSQLARWRFHRRLSIVPFCHKLGMGPVDRTIKPERARNGLPPSIPDSLLVARSMHVQ